MAEIPHRGDTYTLQNTYEFSLSSFLGSGSFATVVKGWHVNDKFNHVAVKLSFAKLSTQRVLREQQTIQKIRDHERSSGRTCQYIAHTLLWQTGLISKQWKNNPIFFQVVEYCNGGDVYKMIERGGKGIGENSVSF